MTMADNRTIELLLDMLYAFLIDYQNILKAAISEEISEKETIARQRAIAREHAERIEQAIAATLGSEREKELEELVRDLLQLRCRQSCADCEHEDDEGCDFMTRALELEIEVY